MKEQITTNTGLLPKQFLLIATMILFFGNAHAQPISITTFVIAGITTNTASSGGDIYSDGGFAVTTRGVCWSTSNSPTVALSTKTNEGSGTGSFKSNITGLTPATIYYVRAYATNAKGTAYGPVLSFTTKPVTLATLTTTPLSNISSTSASGGGNITSDGGKPVTERGICWSTDSKSSPTLGINPKLTSGSGTGSFTGNITGLTPGTTYYVRAYATNAIGTAYGPVVSFTTTALPIATIATLTTTPLSNISSTSASIGGDITSDGGKAVTDRGICWSTKSNPTLELDPKLTSGSGNGSFTVDITELTPGTTYYVRAYATNAIGTAYGPEVIFTTKD